MIQSGGWSQFQFLFLAVNDVIIMSLLLLNICYVLANFLILSDTLLFKFFLFMSASREIWLPPLNSAI